MTFCYDSKKEVRGLGNMKKIPFDLTRKKLLTSVSVFCLTKQPLKGVSLQHDMIADIYLA